MIQKVTLTDEDLEFIGKVNRELGGYLQCLEKIKYDSECICGWMMNLSSVSGFFWHEITCMVKIILFLTHCLALNVGC